MKLEGHRFHTIQSSDGRNTKAIPIQIGGFKITAFDVKHDVPNVGYLIYHQECGTVLFITDTHYCPFKFSNIVINQLIIEANYSEAILSENLENGAVNTKVFYRIKESHMSLETVQGMLRANNITNVNNIVLIHLSSTNSDPELFQKTIVNQTGKSVHIAKKGLRIPFNITPF